MKRFVVVCIVGLLIASQASAAGIQQSEKKDRQLLENISYPMREWNTIGKGSYHKMILTCMEIISPFTREAKTPADIEQRHKAINEAVNVPLEEWWIILEKQDEILDSAQKVLLKYDSDLIGIEQCNKPYIKSAFPSLPASKERQSDNQQGMVDPKNATRIVSKEVAWKRIEAIYRILQAKEEILSATEQWAKIIEEYKYTLSISNSKLRINELWIAINRMRKAILEMKEQVRIMVKIMEEPDKP